MLKEFCDLSKEEQREYSFLKHLETTHYLLSIIVASLLGFGAGFLVFPIFGFIVFIVMFLAFSFCHFFVREKYDTDILYGLKR